MGWDGPAPAPRAVGGTGARRVFAAGAGRGARFRLHGGPGAAVQPIFLSFAPRTLLTSRVLLLLLLWTCIGKQ